MSAVIAFARCLLADERGTMFVKYSSLVLLIALAAIAVLTELREMAN